MAIFTNIAKQRLAAGQVALGYGVQHLRSVGTPMLARTAGFHWLFIDAEHGAFSIQEATQICLAALPLGIAPIVRVCTEALDEGTRALDNGAMGIVVPHVDTPAQARRIAERFRYPPHGHRSWGGSFPAFAYAPPSLAEAQAAIDRETLVIVMIESAEAVAEAAAIAAVPGIDALLIGTSDLSTELGIPGEIGHPRIKDAYRQVGEACRTHGKVLGMGGVYDETHAASYLGMDARLVLAGSDHMFLMQGATARAAAMHRLAGMPV